MRQYKISKLAIDTGFKLSLCTYKGCFNEQEDGSRMKNWAAIVAQAIISTLQKCKISF